MNYRHQYHAGNFADVAKHVLLIQLIRGMQRKEKGFLYLDTHAGRGLYDLSAAARGESLDRRPEWPEGIGRLWGARSLPAPVADYVTLVRSFDRGRGGAAEAESPAHYPGSPLIALALARPQDRLGLCELHPEELAGLRRALPRALRSSVQELDGYKGIRAFLPAPERRALVLIDPPFEDQDEYERILDALAEGLRRAPGATFAVWHPLTERARNDAFLDGLRALPLPATWEVDFSVAGEDSPLRMRGCGLLVVNPPWQLDREVEPWLDPLAQLLAQHPGATAGLRWLVNE